MKSFFLILCFSVMVMAYHEVTNSSGTFKREDYVLNGKLQGRITHIDSRDSVQVVYYDKKNNDYIETVWAVEDLKADNGSGDNEFLKSMAYVICALPLLLITTPVGLAISLMLVILIIVGIVKAIKFFIHRAVCPPACIDPGEQRRRMIDALTNRKISDEDPEKDRFKLY